jgi:hypothetical protein
MALHQKVTTADYQSSFCGFQIQVSVAHFEIRPVAIEAPQIATILPLIPPDMIQMLT